MFEQFLLFLKRLFFATGYFSSGSYPKPLTAEEEAECLAHMQLGSRKAREKLICHNMRLVAHIAKKYAKNNDLEDMISIGSIGLIKGVETFSAEKGANLATYLARCIENEILMNIRANKRYQNTVYLQNTIGVDNDGNEFTLMDVLAAGEDSVFKQAETSILRTSLLKLVHTRLTEREQKIILMRYGIEEGATPLTQLQTARKLGISRSYVSRIETRALEKLREAMQEGE
ncbi:MAG TPA: RNA polymerase subunit sigma-70 [Clostridiales bacterium]|jgi:RNA polymerase sigma factor, sigma-70 family|nr:RNA polymerase subunit sigma-70 [Clostridiales bacterium]